MGKIRGKAKQQPTLVVLIPGAGRWGTRHPFFPECEKGLAPLGVTVVKSDVRDQRNSTRFTPIKEKARQTVEVVGQHIQTLNPGKVIVIGHSQGYLTGGNAIDALKLAHPGTPFYLIGVCNPRSREEHDRGFNEFLRIMGKRPIKAERISDGVQMEFEPQYQIQLRDDPLIKNSRNTRMPRLLADRRALCGRTHFLEYRAVRKDIILALAEYVQRITYNRQPGEPEPNRELLILG